MSIPNSPSNTKPKNVDNVKEERENPYSNAVLIGNWVEERFAHKCDRKAISPAIYGASDCMQDISIQRSDFKPHNIKRKDDDYGDFTLWRQEAFHNRFQGEKTNMQLTIGEQFDNNSTTLNDIVYRILPAQDIYYNVLLPKKKKFDFDFAKSYGNQTETGLLRWLGCERAKEKNTPIDMSHYKLNFKPYKIDPKRCRYKAEQRKTKIWDY